MRRSPNHMLDERPHIFACVRLRACSAAALREKAAQTPAPGEPHPLKLFLYEICRAVTRETLGGGKLCDALADPALLPEALAPTVHSSLADVFWFLGIEITDVTGAEGQRKQLTNLIGDLLRDKARAPRDPSRSEARPPRDPPAPRCARRSSTATCSRRGWSPICCRREKRSPRPAPPPRPPPRHGHWPAPHRPTTVATRSPGTTTVPAAKVLSSLITSSPPSSYTTSVRQDVGLVKDKGDFHKKQVGRSTQPPRP